ESDAKAYVRLDQRGEEPERLADRRRRVTVLARAERATREFPVEERDGLESLLRRRGDGTVGRRLVERLEGLSSQRPPLHPTPPAGNGSHAELVQVRERQSF